MADSQRLSIHALVFEDPERTVAAVRALRGAGFVVPDVHSPFPLHGIEAALGLPPSRLALATLVGALLGGSLKLCFQSWVHIFDWPMNIGGKSPFSLPALVPITFEVTVLVAAFFTLGALFLRRGLYPRLRPEESPSQPLRRVTDDRFVVLVEERDGGFAPEHFRRLCATLAPTEVIMPWRTL